MSLILKPGTAWTDAYARCAALAPEAFHDDRVLNLWGGKWRRDGEPIPATSPVDGSEIAGPPLLGVEEARAAVAAAAQGHQRWRQAPLDVRKAKVAAALDAMTAERDLLALLLVWEIGKSWRSAITDVDRCIDGVRWYVEEIDRMLDHRTSLPGPVSNIASWNYPMSVLMHAMLVQLLAGNAVIAKTPTDGGLACLTLACALAAREGLPITLVSGSGSALSSALVEAPEIGCVSFVGGRTAGAQVESRIVEGKRHILEQEGLNCWGVWEFSDWDTLAGHLRKGFEYAKQRCTAYPRYVVQRSLFDEFLAAYIPVLDEVRFGHPLAVASPDDELPDLEFGPLINAAKVKDLQNSIAETLGRGGVPLYRGDVRRGRFLELTAADGAAVADAAKDLAKIAVIERHLGTGRIGLGFVRGSGLRRGALASTVAHDAHNIVVVGMDDGDMVRAVARLGELNGGIVVVDGGEIRAELPLPVAGLLADAPLAEVIEQSLACNDAARALGWSGATPFLTLSFLGLSVIPSLKITDRGLVDVDRFEIVPLAL